MVGIQKPGRIFSFIGAILILISLIFSVLPAQAMALSGSSFKPGRIIDNYVFYNYRQMSASGIQTFLNSKVPTCDTNHTQSSSSNDPGPPYTCLKSYSVKVPARSADAYCPGAITSSGTSKKTAAKIIYMVAQACHINPRVLIVTLQKESGLITDTWPWPIQYSTAMGYGCPDSSGCSPTYAGFFKQVYYAARQFQIYSHNPSGFNFVAGTTNFIQYNPKSSCGGSNVYISTQATAGLYNYTPYQPNIAALKNLYGSGNTCSAYGNRNFWRYYNDWFGSTLANPIAVTISDTTTSEDGKSIKAEFSLVSKPTANVTIPLSVSDSTEAALNKTSITITPTTWNTPSDNVVLITGLNDTHKDGDIGYHLITGQPVSDDTTYSNLSSFDTPNPLLVNIDNEPDTALVGKWLGTATDSVSLRRGDEFIINIGGGSTHTARYGMGRDSDVPFAGNFGGSANTDVGLKRGTSYFIDTNNNGNADITFAIGRVTDQVFVGDWDGNGTDNVGLKRGNFYYLLRDDGSVLRIIHIGRDSDQVIVGNWDGAGGDSIGLKRGKYYYLLTETGGVYANFGMGRDSDQVFVGKWNGTRSGIGLKRGSSYFLDTNNNGNADVAFAMGQASDQALVGNWDGAGGDSLALRRGTTFFIDNNNDGQEDSRFTVNYFGYF